jgi:hypothetical protein
VNAAIWPVGAATAGCLVVAVCCIPPEGFWPRVLKAAGRLLWAFCCHMCRNPKRSPVPRHGPAAKAMRSAPVTLSDEDVADRWPDLEKRLADIPEQRNGGDR